MSDFVHLMLDCLRFSRYESNQIGQCFLFPPSGRGVGGLLETRFRYIVDIISVAQIILWRRKCGLKKTLLARSRGDFPLFWTIISQNKVNFGGKTILQVFPTKFNFLIRETFSVFFGGGGGWRNKVYLAWGWVVWGIKTWSIDSISKNCDEKCEKKFLQNINSRKNRRKKIEHACVAVFVAGGNLRGAFIHDHETVVLKLAAHKGVHEKGMIFTHITVSTLIQLLLHIITFTSTCK